MTCHRVLEAVENECGWHFMLTHVFRCCERRENGRETGQEGFGAVAHLRMLTNAFEV